MSQKTRSYSSDLMDKQWHLMESILMKPKGPGRPLELEMRRVVDAIFYVIRTGCQWKNLPSEYPNPNSVYYHFRQWCRNGTWQQLNETLRQQERQHHQRPSLTARASRRPKQAVNEATMLKKR